MLFMNIYEGCFYKYIQLSIIYQFLKDIIFVFY